MYISVHWSYYMYACFSCLSSAGAVQVNTSQQLAELRQAHPVLFLMAHEGQELFDRDWHSIFSKVAREQALMGKFVYTTNTDIVKVSFPLIVGGLQCLIWKVS